MPDSNLKKKLFQTYLKMIENSPGTKLFNSAFVEDVRTGEVRDVLNDGELSCAFFVSGVLSLLGLMDRPHSTVKTVIDTLRGSKNWKEFDKKSLKNGDIIVWEVVTFEDGTQNEHIGFCLDTNKAVSTSYIEKSVVLHSIDFDGKRKIEKIFRYSA